MPPADTSGDFTDILELEDKREHHIGNLWGVAPVARITFGILRVLVPSGRVGNLKFKLISTKNNALSTSLCFRPSNLLYFEWRSRAKQFSPLHILMRVFFLYLYRYFIMSYFICYCNCTSYKIPVKVFPLCYFDTLIHSKSVHDVEINVQK